MLNPEYPNFEKKSLDDLELTLSEPIKKINIRGKKKEFFTKVGKILSIILPMNQILVHQISILMLFG